MVLPRTGNSDFGGHSWYTASVPLSKRETFKNIRGVVYLNMVSTFPHLFPSLIRMWVKSASYVERSARLVHIYFKYFFPGAQIGQLIVIWARLWVPGSCYSVAARLSIIELKVKNSAVMSVSWLRDQCLKYIENNNIKGMQVSEKGEVTYMGVSILFV